MARFCLVRQFYYPQDPRVRKEADALVQRGHSVDVLCMRRPGEPATEVVDGVRVCRLPLRHSRGGPIRYAGEYLAFFAAAAASLTALHLRRPYDVVQVHSMPDFLVFASLLPRALGARVVFEMHEPMPEIFATKFGEGRMRPVVRLMEVAQTAAIRYADAVLTVSEQVKASAVSRGAPAEKIGVVLNVPSDTLEATAGAAGPVEPSESFRLVTHGLVERRYGHHLLLEAVHLLRDRIPELRLDVLGEGEYLADMKRLAARLDLSGVVRFAGHVDYAEMVRTIALASVGVVAVESNPWSELVHTNKMFDYVALGVPVVITRTRPVAELFDDSQVAFFRPGDARDLARAIDDLYADPDRRVSLAERAREVYEGLAWPRQREVYLRVVEGLLSPDSLVGLA